MFPDSQNATLFIVGKSASRKKEWELYSRFCLARNDGLRKNAFTYLDQFLTTTEGWTFEQCKEFTCFLLDYIDSCDDPDYDIIPDPVNKILIEPTLKRWCEIEKTNSAPFRWLGNQASLLKSIEINPFDDKAREKLLQMWMQEIYFSIHHLPEVYIGSLSDDLKLLGKIKEQIDLLCDMGKHKKLTESFAEDEELIVNYTLWETSGTVNFKQWGIDNKKKVGYRISYKD